MSNLIDRWERDSQEEANFITAFGPLPPATAARHGTNYEPPKPHPEGALCYLCGNRYLGDFMQMDHIIPRAHGGTNDDYNLASACWRCNLEKSDRIVSFDVLSGRPSYTSVRSC